MLRKLNLWVLLFVSLLFATSAFALTAKVGNPRAVVYADVTPDKPAYISRTLEIINVNDVAVNIVMDVSENCKDMLTIRQGEGEFTLQPDQSKDVPYVIKVVQPAFTECKINSYFTVEDDTGPGVALASVIIVNVKGEGPELPPEEEIPEETPEEIPEEGGDVTGGVSVNPGGKPNLDNNQKPNLNVFAIGFFVLMLVVVILLAIVALKRRRRSGEDEIKV